MTPIPPSRAPGAVDLDTAPPAPGTPWEAAAEGVYRALHRAGLVRPGRVGGCADAGGPAGCQRSAASDHERVVGEGQDPEGRDGRQGTGRAACSRKSPPSISDALLC